MFSLKFVIEQFFNFNGLLKKRFSFLNENFGFKVTEDPKLVIKEWLVRGIAYTNNSYVIIVTDDIREKKFSTIIYEIQNDFVIPINNKDKYFTLNDFLKRIDSSYHYARIENYESINDLEECIDNSSHYLGEYFHLLFN